MENQTNITEQIVTLVLNTWSSRNTAVTNFFNKYNDEAVYLDEVAPGRNSAIYLLGHLTATNDAMLPLLGAGEKLFPELAVFSTSPDKSFENNFTLSELKAKWETVNAKLSDYFKTLSANGWLERHTAVSEEDFKKEPQRNKLNLLLGRTNHQSYHLGQLNLLTVKEAVA